MPLDLDAAAGARPAPTAVPASRPRRVTLAPLAAFVRRNWIPLAGILGFCVLAVLVYGGNPLSSSRLPQCACGDELQEVWFLAWPAHALANGLNPFSSQLTAYPRGVDLMSSTSMPLLGVLMAPVTLTLGPVAAYNLLARLALALSATAMTLVLRRFVRSWPAALAGGLLYGFSPFFMVQGLSHLFLTFSPLPPLVLLLLDELLVRRRRRPLWTGMLLGLAAVAQLLISAEVLAITGLFALGAVVLMVVRHPVAARGRAAHALAGAGAAAVTFVVLGAYPVWEYLAGPQHVSGRQHPAATYVAFQDDVLATVLPTSEQWLGWKAVKVRGNVLTEGNVVDHMVYLGLPLLLLLAYVVVRFRRKGVVSLAALLGLGGVLLALGDRLHVDGHLHLHWLRLPYAVVMHVPVLDGILAPRFALGAYFFAAVLLAVGLDLLWHEGLVPRRAGRRAEGAAPPPGGAGRAVALAACTAVALLPLVPRVPLGSNPVPVPALFTTPALLDRIPPGSVVLAYPDAQLPSLTIATAADPRAMLWQAVAGMRFAEIGSYSAQPAPGGGLGQGDALLDAPIVVQRMFGWAQLGPPAMTPVPDTPATEAALRTFCRRYGVSTIVVDPTAGAQPAVVVRYVTRALGTGPTRAGGVDAWFGVGGDLGAGRARQAAKPVPPAPPTAPTSTTGTTSTTAATVPVASTGAGVLPQTTALPSSTTAAFHAEMQALWAAIVAGRPALAASAFFPLAAYEQVKAIADPAADWRDRLLLDFELDVAAAHALLGGGAAGARLLSVPVASSEAAWIPPGYCYNVVGYWHAPGARLVYEEGGVVRSIGVASLISWRGVWYVVHLGAVLRTSTQGIVDDPTTGPGQLPPPGGC